MALEKAGLQLILEGANAFMSGVGSAEKATKGLLGTFADAGKAVAGAALTAGAAGAVALGGGIALAAKAGLGFNNAMEQTTAKLNAFTKDGAKSAAILEEIKKEASLTPFAFEEMATATASLLPVAKSSGKELMSLVKTAEILAASNPAEGLEGAAFALKEAASGDLTSVIERFNLPRQRLNELKEQGVPAIEAVGIAMKEMGLDADLVSNLANTASGRWSTFLDTMTNLAATVTKPIFDAFSKGLGNVNGLLDANMPLIQGIADTLAGKLAGAIEGTIKTITTFAQSWGVAGEYTGGFLERLGATIDLMTGADGTFQTIGATITTVFATIGQGVALAMPLLQGVVGVIMQLGQTFMTAGPLSDTFIQSISQLSPVLGGLLTIVQTVFPAIQSIVMSVFGILSSFIAQNGDQMASDIQAIWSGIQATISAVATAIGAVVGAIFGQIAIFLQAHGAEITAFLTTAWTQISTIIQLALQLINATVVPILTAIASFISAHSAEIQAILSAAWTAISTIITTVLGVIQGVITAVLAIIRGDWQGAWEAIKGILDTVLNGILTLIRSTMTIVQTIITVGLTLLTSIWLAAWELMKAKFQAILDSIVGWVKQTFEGIKNAITSMADGIGSAAASVGSAIVSGITRAISGGIGAITSAARDAAMSALNAAKSALGIGSPSKVAAAEVGLPYTQGVALGIETNAGLIAKAVEALSMQMITPLAQTATAPSGARTSYTQHTTYNLGVTTNQSPAAAAQSFALMQAMAL